MNTDTTTKINFLLPMKGHSERVPGKNMKIFRGKPLYHSVMAQLLNSRYRGRVLVDTDSEIIAADVQQNFPEVEIINRPVELCGDDVSMNRIIKHDISVSEGEYFLQTHSTNPLLSRETIERAIEFFLDNAGSYDSLFGVNRIQSRLYNSSGVPINHDPESLIKTQDLEPVYEENSNIYIFSRESFFNAGEKRIGRRPFMYEIPRFESLDIDTRSDFDMALFLAEFLKKNVNE